MALAAVVTAVVAGLAAVRAWQTPRATPSNVEAHELGEAAERWSAELRELGTRLLAGEDVVARLAALPAFVSWELGGPNGGVETSGGRLPVLPGNTTLRDDGVLRQRVVELRAPGGATFAGALTLEQVPLDLLEGLPRPSLAEFLERTRLKSTVPAAERWIDALALLAIALALSLAALPRLPRIARLSSSWTLGCAGALLLSTSASLPAPLREPSIAFALPTASDATGFFALLLARISPATTPLSVLATAGLAGLLALAIRRLVRRAGHLLELGTCIALAIVGLALLRALATAVTETRELVVLDPDTAFSALSSVQVEVGLLALGMTVSWLGVESLLATWNLLHARLTLPPLSKLTLVALLGACLVTTVVVWGEHARLQPIVRTYAGTDEKFAEEQLGANLEVAVAGAAFHPGFVEAFSNGDLERAAILAWSSCGLAETLRVARVTLEDPSTGSAASFELDVPPNWRPEASPGGARTATAVHEPTEDEPWRLTIAIPREPDPLVNQATTELLATARRRTGVVTPRILRAWATAEGVVLPDGRLPGSMQLPRAVIAGAAEDWAVRVARFEGERFLVSAAAGLSRPDQLAVVAIALPSDLDVLMRALRALLLALGLAALAAVLSTLRRRTPRDAANARKPFLGRFDVRVLVITAFVALAPLAIVSLIAPRLASGTRQQAVEARLLEVPSQASAFLHDDITREELGALGRSLGLVLSIYDRGRLTLSARPELHQLALTSGRPSPAAMAELATGRTTVLVEEEIANLAVPTIYTSLDEQRLLSASILTAATTIDETASPAVARLQVIIFAVMLLFIVVASRVAYEITAPVRALTRAADRVAGGDLTAHVDKRPSPMVGNEIADLVASFERMIAQLEESREKLVAAERDAAWKEMARQVAHEIKNPLTPMLMSVQHLQRVHADGADDFDAVLDKVTVRMLREIDRLKRIAEDFSDFSRFPTRERKRIDLRDLAQDLADLYAEDGRVSVRLAETPVTVEADPAELHRVLVNLVKNALEAVEEREDGHVVILAEPCEAGARLAVEDNGPGIPDDVRPRLFEPYFSTKTRGTGLGLAIVARAIEAHGGTVTATDAPEGGTIFEILLPASSTSAPPL